MKSEVKERIEKIEDGIVPEGYKETEVGIIPKDWEVKKLGEIKDDNDRHSFAGGPFGSNLKVSDYLEKGIRIIQLQNIGDGYFDYNNRIYTSIEKANELFSSNIYPGDIIIAKMAEPLARACIIPNDEDRYLMASDGIRLKLNSKNNVLYIKECINSRKFRNEAYRLGTGTTRKRISLTDLRKMEIPTPALKEQEKIADILSTWDKAIEKIEKLIKEKESQKKGLMQKLLTGEIRLPGFSGEWKEVKLGDVCKIINGGTPSTTNINYWNGDIFWATPTDITGNSKFIDKTSKKITNEGLKNSSANLLPVNSILMTSRATIGEKSINTQPMATNQGFKSFVCKKNSYYEYIYYLIEVLKKDFLKVSSGSTFLEISKSDTESIIIKNPPLPEQKAIADILSTADREIELLKELLENKKEEKKGLMQLLLTGIVRV